MKFEYQDRKKKIIRYSICALLGVLLAVGLFFVFERRGSLFKRFISSTDVIQNKKDHKNALPFGCKKCKEEEQKNHINDVIEKVDAEENNNLGSKSGDYLRTASNFLQQTNANTSITKSNEEYAKLVDKLAQSVVHIKMISLRDTDDNDRYSLLTSFGGEVFPKKKVKVLGSCSGFFVSQDGYIVTNHHCIDDVQDIEVETKDGSNFKGKVVGYFEGADLAVIKVEPKKGEKFVATKIGNSDRLSVGDNIIIIGGPLGYKWSASAGIVSGKARDLTYGDDNTGDKKHVWGSSGELIQVDVAVNPGNSGGPAFNMDGEVVGVASAGILFFQGMNFMVSSNTLKENLADLKKGKIIQKGLWGVNVSEMESYDLKAVGIEKNSGMLVQDVIKFSPAEKAGIKRGDIITSVDGIALKDKVVMKNINSKVFDGSVNTLEINRYGKLLRLQVKAISVREMEKLEKGEIGLQEWDDKNISYRLLTAPKHDKFKFPKDVGGIIIVDIKNADDPMLTFNVGDVIMGVNDKEVKSIEDYQKIIFGLKKQKKNMAMFHIYKPMTKQIIVKGSKFE